MFAHGDCARDAEIIMAIINAAAAANANSYWAINVYRGACVSITYTVEPVLSARPWELVIFQLSTGFQFNAFAAPVQHYFSVIMFVLKHADSVSILDSVSGC